MQTRDAPEKVTPLPPPPAPPARDANPWQWPEEAGSAAQPQQPVLLRRPGRRKATTQAASQVPRLGLAIGIAVLVMVIALSKALGGAGPRDWAGVAFAVFLVVMVAVRRLRGSRRRSDPGREAGDDAPPGR
jgi:Flp pilus assembly protein TadB